ncbi:MAG TPA: iron-sulfur cluster assembly scaffold protein [Candidatus Nanopelagicaceae bacterium]|nr:iron-sulfur cluster assembly scaffold protein [Candidatus Nanopelagicaceae bacterium]
MPKDKFDEYVENLQEIILEEEIKEYNERIVKLYHDPKNWGKPSEDEINISKTYEGPCGDTMSFFLKINNNVIEKANFLTDGCGASVAAGCQTTLLIENKSLEDAEKLKPEDIDAALDGLPKDHKHCAELAIRTLKRAIDDYKILVSLK